MDLVFHSVFRHEASGDCHRRRSEPRGMCARWPVPYDGSGRAGPEPLVSPRWPVLLREITIIRSIRGTVGLAAHLTRPREPPRGASQPTDMPRSGCQIPLIADVSRCLVGTPASNDPVSSVAEHVPHLLHSTGEVLQVTADSGHLPEFLNLREGVGQRDCLAVRLSQKVLVAVKEPTPNPRPAAAAAETFGGIELRSAEPLPMARCLFVQ